MAGHCFVPPYLLRQIAHYEISQGRLEDAEWIEQMLAHDDGVRLQRTTVTASAPPGPAWGVHDAHSSSALPGALVRSPGDDPTGDLAVDEAAEGVAASLALFSEVYGRDSYDDAGATVWATVHYQRNYDNAFWNGQQLVFGDGDGRTFDRFTKPVDVLGHELTHAVTEHTAGLVYEGQSGALNESVSDVFASCLKQRLLGQDAAAGDWLIGAGLFLPGVQGRALRDMAHPGTAYDDPVLGKDPQPDHMDDYIDTTDDHGGVHLNSGIPNRAFHLAATAIGGSVWEGAGLVWYAALTSGTLATDADFVSFAAATVAAAGDHVEAVRGAWLEVGVDPAGAPVAGPPVTPASVPAGVVAVRRSGGFAGRTTYGTIDLDGGDPRVPEVRELVTGLDLRKVAPALPKPDMFTYTFEICGADPVAVPQQHLSERLHRLAELVLSEGEEPPSR
jgi:thermolysin metallopeptidase-like protein/emfourin